MPKLLIWGYLFHLYKKSKMKIFSSKRIKSCCWKEADLAASVVVLDPKLLDNIMTAANNMKKEWSDTKLTANKCLAKGETLHDLDKRWWRGRDSYVDGWEDYTEGDAPLGCDDRCSYGPAERLFQQLQNCWNMPLKYLFFKVVEPLRKIGSSDDGRCGGKTKIIVIDVSNILKCKIIQIKVLFPS